MDLATIIGVVVAFGMVGYGIVIGGGASGFLDIPSALIVFGGTFGATLVNFPLKEVFGLWTVVKNAFFHKPKSLSDAAVQLVDFAKTARRDGILALETVVADLDNEFLKKGVQLAVDGTEPELTKAILELEIDYLRDRHRIGAAILDAMGTYAPALGMIGTLIGLVQMLRSMDDPSSIGPAMAVALVTTFYGALIANLLCIPLAGKLKKRSEEEALIKELIIAGISSIQSGDNPRVVEQKLNAFIPPKLRTSSFE